MKPIVVLAVVLVAAGIAGAAWFYQPPTHTAEEFGIATYVSPHDTDADGVDDQADILASARAYVATNPRYASAYFDGGRPTDGTGVCTDVVDQALLGAGYDLQALVDKDIRENPSAYDIETPDANIDFRRVRNLRVWFDRHAQSLTIDPTDIAAWQPGDIVCWSEHIGIVSDARNAHGIPLVIHNGSPFQAHYEEDVLTSTTWGPITNHWRLSVK